MTPKASSCTSCYTTGVYPSGSRAARGSRERRNTLQTPRTAVRADDATYGKDPWRWNVKADVEQETSQQGNWHRSWPSLGQSWQPPPKSPSSPWASACNAKPWLRFWVGLAFLLINGTIGQARVIPSGSMENTLLIGDHLIMSRIGYDAGCSLHQLARPALAQSQAPADHHFQAALRARSAGLRQARHRPCPAT